MSESAQSENWYAELPHLGVLEVGGADAAKFLQGQATCDVLALDDETSSLGAFCTAQGRVLAVFRVLRSAGLFRLIMPRELIEPVAKRLRMYVLRSAVSVNDVSEAWLCLGLSCKRPDGFAWLGLSRRGQVVTREGSVLDWPAHGTARALAMVRGRELGALRDQAVAQGLIGADAERWLLEDIRAGIPRVSPALSEEFIPQMLNLDLLGGIGFKKGCYTGQEVVARTQYLGAVKRRLFRLVLAEGATTPEPGSRVQAPGEEQAVGTVVCAAALPGTPVELLAVLIGEPVPGVALNINGVVATVFDPPYQVA